MKTNSVIGIFDITLMLTLVAVLFINYGCEWNGQPKAATATLATNVVPGNPNTGPEHNSNNAATILARKQVPILCYHQLREFRPTDSKTARDYIVPPSNFREQLKMLHDSGYQTILPDQLMDYLVMGKPLPPKPIMLTFDDADLEQYTVAEPELKKYGYKAVFFIMTVVLDRPRYMTREQVKMLAEEGHVIGSHTWDHNNVKKFHADDWVKQVDKPSKQLEQITGKPIKYFAYPFGLWNAAAIPELKKRGFASAFQLSAKRDEQDPLYTIRRMIVPGSWTTPVLRAWMHMTFDEKKHG